MGRKRQIRRRIVVTSDESTGELSNVPTSSFVAAEDIRKEQLSTEVFGNDLIREIILLHAIHKKGTELDRDAVCTLRLMRKDWCRTITEICHKSKQPLYKLVLNKENSVQDTQHVRNNGKLLDQFLTTLNSKDKTGKSPTYSLKFLQDFFRQENYSSLTNCFVKHGAKLVELEMYLPINVGSLKCIFPHFNFPSLRKLTFNPTTVKLSNISTPEAPSDNVSHLLNSLLNGAVNLQEFIIPLAPLAIRPPDFQCLNLPTSLTRIELGCASTSENLQILARNKFPYLTHLKFVAAENPRANEGLVEILENVRKSLKSLTLIGQSYTGPPRNLTRLKFPVMPKLEDFCNSSINLELEPGSASLKYLPKLKCVSLYHQTVPMLRKWTENYVYSSMQQISLLLVNEEAVNAAQDDYWLGIKLEIMQSVHMSFPNIRILHLYIRDKEVCGLKYVFMEMTQLINLKIEVKTDMAGPDFWDGLLIGAPLEFVAALRMTPDFWGQVQLNSDGHPSIKSLTELRTFSLLQKKTTGIAPHSNDEHLISDLTFHFALMKIPKLRTLFLNGKFAASKEMIDKWKKQGRYLSYTA